MKAIRNTNERNARKALYSLVILAVMLILLSSYLILNLKSSANVIENKNVAITNQSNIAAQSASEKSNGKGILNSIKESVKKISSSVGSITGNIVNELQQTESSGDLPYNPTSMQEGCYIKLNIWENFSSATNITSFSLYNLTNLYGLYDLEISNSTVISPYNLTLFDGNDVLLAKYPLDSARFFSADGPSGSANGTIKVLNSSIMEKIIPYNSSIKKIKVEKNGTVTDLKINPSSIACVRTCKLEDEFGTYGKDMCCNNLTANQIDSFAFACSRCGDGICSSTEDYYTCQQDCAWQWPEDNESVITSCENNNIILPGEYTLKRDLKASSRCITINANDTTVDCKGHKIIYGISSPEAAVLVNNSNNVTIRNCTLIEYNSDWNNVAIDFEYSNNGFIQYNNISAKNWGIVLGESSNNSIANNKIYGSGSPSKVYFGSGSSYNNITGNVINSTCLVETSLVEFYGDRMQSNIVNNNILYFRGYNSNGVLLAQGATTEKIINNVFNFTGNGAKAIGSFTSGSTTSPNMINGVPG